MDVPAGRGDQSMEGERSRGIKNIVGLIFGGMGFGTIDMGLARTSAIGKALKRRF